MLKLGMQNISALYVGGAKIKRALVGTEVVYEAVRPPAVFSISASVTPASGGSVTGAGQYREGDTVTLTYTPAEDHRFTGWYAGNTLLSQANPYTFTAAQDMSITATCEVVPTYTLTLIPTGISAQNWSFSILVNGSGATWSGSGASPSSPAPNPVSVKEGSVTVEATSPDGYEFAGWQIGSGSVVTSNPYTFTITGDTTLYCRYAKKSRLPAGYTEVEWIQPSTNTSKLDTKAYIGTTSILTMDADLVSPIVTKGYNYVICGIQIAGGKATLQQILVASTGIRAAFFSNNATSGPPGVLITSNLNPRNITFSVDVASKTVSVNSEKTSELSYFSGGPINIGGNGTVSFLTQTGMRIKRFKVERTASTTASYNKELIPCKNANGTIGMFDIVNNVFLTATGTWTAGPAV